MKALASCLLACAAPALARAQDITIQPGDGAGGLGAALLRNVGHPVSALLDSDPAAAGYWTATGSNNYGLSGRGVILSTGRVSVYGSGPNSSPGFTVPFGRSATDEQDELLAPVTGTMDNHDVADLSLTFMPSQPGRRVAVTVVFGSEEWPEFVGMFNDGLAVYVNGVGVAYTLDGQPVGVLNSNFALPPVEETELDNVLAPWGTPRVHFAFTPTAGINSVRILLGDASDGYLDSTVYIEPFEYTACFADFNLDGYADGTDIELFLAAFEAGLPVADLDGDGFVSGRDYDQFVTEFELGC